MRSVFADSLKSYHLLHHLLLPPICVCSCRSYHHFTTAAQLQDYILYLESAALGVPSVFTIARDSVFPHSQEHQQQHDQKKRTSDFQAACEAAGVAAATLSLLNKQQVRLPGHITREQLVGLAQQLKEPDATADLQDVVQLFSDFGEAKRMAFREVLDELLGAAGAAAASTKGRF